MKKESDSIVLSKWAYQSDKGAIPVDRTKQMSTPCGCFFVWYATDNSTGIEGRTTRKTRR